MPKPGVVLPDWAHQYRIVSSEYPPINFFETLVDPDLMDELFHIEGLTNDRLRTETGEIASDTSTYRPAGSLGTAQNGIFFDVVTQTGGVSLGVFGFNFAARTLPVFTAEEDEAEAARRAWERRQQWLGTTSPNSASPDLEGAQGAH